VGLKVSFPLLVQGTKTRYKKSWGKKPVEEAGEASFPAKHLMVGISNNARNTKLCLLSKVKDHCGFIAA
jgi:hypothetical protein